MHLSAGACGHSAVVRLGAKALLAESLGEALGVRAGGDVDEPGLRGGERRLDDRPLLRGVVLVPLDGEVDVRPVESADQHARVVEAEPFDDVRSHGRRAGGRQRDHGRMPQRRDHRPELQVVGTEVVPPRRDAVGLIDDEQGHPERFQLGEDLGLGELLGGEEHELGATRRDRLPGAFVRGTRVGGVHRDGGALADRGLEVTHLVGLQRDERRDHERRSVEEVRGDLVDRRLAVPGRHDREHVAPAHQGLDGLRLPRLQGLPPEHVAGDLAYAR